MSDRVEESAQAAKGREGSGYQYKKIGDLLEEIDDLFSQKRDVISTKATEKVQDMLAELKSLYKDLKAMANEPPQNVDPNDLKRKQNHLNDLENKAVQGVYGAEAKICPLDQAGQPVHHVRVQAIPPGQATVRGLIEKCHQMVTRVLDRLEEAVASKEAGKGEFEHKQQSPHVAVGARTAEGTTASITQLGPGAGISAH